MNAEGGPARVRLSLAAALALGLRSGRTYRGARTSCVNLLLDYPVPCFSRCAYCGLSRHRPLAPGGPESFIRVEWPAFPTELVRARIAEREPAVKRVCVSMVENPRAFEDAERLCRSIRTSTGVPISVLIHPRGLGAPELLRLRQAGADMIGIGLDAASPRLFARVRPGLEWDTYWRTVLAARSVFGPGKVNCHVVVGLGESDQDLLRLASSLRERQVSTYLFCFYPEPGTRLAGRRRPPLSRWRRLQVATFLLGRGLPLEALRFRAGRLAEIAIDARALAEAIRSGAPFRTHGCPDAQGQVACTRPFGSYRPGEPFRDFPFPLEAQDVARAEREARARWFERPPRASFGRGRALVRQPDGCYGCAP
ncbi:MAG: radical SAM protein [Myxococcales bacterium]|nr:radical SAM protein [Myxococcales bacterium]